MVQEQKADMTPTYQVVKAPSEAQLADRVSGYMAQGWQCQGSPFWWEKGQSWAQAMTRAAQEDGVRLREPKRK